MKLQAELFTLVCGALLLEVLPLADAHGDGYGAAANNTWHRGDGAPEMESNLSSMSASSYFKYNPHARLIYTHVLFMVLAWMFVLPIGIALSIARSRMALLIQSCFLVMNTIGIFIGMVYNRNAPDLYPNNAHHKLGWIVTAVWTTQAVMGLVGLLARWRASSPSTYEERKSFIPVSAEALAEHGKTHSTQRYTNQRFSADSGQGTERASSSLRSELPFTTDEGLDRQPDGVYRESLEGDEATSGHTCLKRNTASSVRRAFELFSAKIRSTLSDRVLRVGEFIYDAVDRLILPLGFVAMIAGIVTYGGILQGESVFNGLAHFIKGGIFFWYGLATLGRWMGAYADFGWAWNIKPPAALVGRRKAAVPSAEFVESFTICLYGSTNAFMEHMAAWGKAWTVSDLQHVSISIMFFGGGLCGMLVESRRIRDLLNMPLVTIASSKEVSAAALQGDHDSSWTPPATYRFSFNPLPALVILLLGMMMSSHHQASVVSTMVHKQWGMLLVGFALARAVTYLTLYVLPPPSLLPSRPPSELVASFCLISAGLIFMASNKDTIAAMERYDLDAMFVFTVTMGFTAFVMAWTILVGAVKGSAVRRRNAKRPSIASGRSPGWVGG